MDSFDKNSTVSSIRRCRLEERFFFRGSIYQCCIAAAAAAAADAAAAVASDAVRRRATPRCGRRGIDCSGGILVSRIPPLEAMPPRGAVFSRGLAGWEGGRSMTRSEPASSAGPTSTSRPWTPGAHVMGIQSSLPSRWTPFHILLNTDIRSQSAQTSQRQIGQLSRWIDRGTS